MKLMQKWSCSYVLVEEVCQIIENSGSEQLMKAKFFDKDFYLEMIYLKMPFLLKNSIHDSFVLCKNYKIKYVRLK